MSSYLVTGASRGIGLELVRQLSEFPESQVGTIFAVTRSKSAKLDELITSSPRIANITIPDMTSPQDVAKGVAEVEKHLNGKGLDVLINNAGIMRMTNGGAGKAWDMETKDLTESVEANVVTVHVMTAGFLNTLRKGQGKKIVNITSPYGSISLAKTYAGPSHPYKITKATLNMLTAQYAVDLEEEGFCVVGPSPGWLKTEMGSEYADLDVSVGVKALIDVILGLDPSKNGKFLNILVPGWEHNPGVNQYDGKEFPW